MPKFRGDINPLSSFISEVCGKRKIEERNYEM